MSSMKKYKMFLISFFIVVQIEALVKLSDVEDNNISTTERRIRNTVNKLFTFLKVQDIHDHNSKLSQFSTIHDSFTSNTLTDSDNLNEIARLTRVGNIDNNSQNFIAQINEVLNEGDKNDEDNVYVTKYIETFIKKLKDLKEIYGPNGDKRIKESIWKYFGNHHILNNTHLSVTERNEDVLSDNVYWQPSGRRFANGIKTKIKQFPFIASVHFFKQFHCAGSIIKSDLVITSASCLQIAWNNRFFRENPRFLSVQVGSDYYEGSGENIDVLEIYFHPQYNAKNLNHNLAIMRLYKHINFRYHKYVKKIDFDRNPWPLPVNCAPITVIGWGARDHNNIVYDVFRNRLHYAELDFYSLHNCQEHYTKQYVTERHFCAGSYSKGDGACNRDAGGPGIIEDKLVGVISFGSPVCGALDAPTVFTKLGFYADWIDDIMQREVPSVKTRTTTRPPKTYYSLLPPYITSQFSLTPVSLAPIEPLSSKLQQIPIRDVDSLRVAPDQGFKDFMQALFEDDEINELLGNPDLDSPEIKEKQEAPILKTQTTPKMVPTAKSMLNYYKEEENTKLVAKNDLYESTESNIKATILGETSSHEKSLEEDIKALVDNLDLEKLFQPPHLSAFNNGQISSDISENISKQTIADQRNIVKETFAEGMIEKKLKPSQYSLDRNKDPDDKIVKKPHVERQIETSMVMMPLSYEENNDKGLSIAEETFKDLTFRDKTDVPDSDNGVPDPQLVDLIALPVEAEVRKIRDERRHIS